MAIVDAIYNFLYVDCNSRVSDGGVFGNCSFKCALDNNDLNLPQPKPLPGRQATVPFVLVANDAFRMQKHLLKRYPGKSLSAGQRIFNYRLSRVRYYGKALSSICLFFKTKCGKNYFQNFSFFLLKKVNYTTSLLTDPCDDNGAFIPGT